MSQPAHMWTYWRDKRGIVEALRCDYPDILALSPTLQQALYQIQAAEALINRLMSDLPDEDEL